MKSLDRLSEDELKLFTCIFMAILPVTPVKANDDKKCIFIGDSVHQVKIE